MSDVAERDINRGLAHDEGEVSLPLSRDIPRETNEQPMPPAPDGHAATGEGNAPHRSRRRLALSLGALLLPLVGLHCFQLLVLAFWLGASQAQSRRRRRLGPSTPFRA